MIPKTSDRPSAWDDGGQTLAVPDGPSVLPAYRDAGPLATLALETERDGRVGVWEWRLDLGRVRWSPGLFALLGIDPSVRLTLDDLPSLIVPEDREPYQCFFQRCQAGDPPNDTVFRLFGPDNRILHLRTRVRIPQVGANGQPLVIRGTVVDVTELVDHARQREIAREAAETARRRLEAGIAAMGEAFALWDPQDRLELWNRRFEDMYAAVRPHIRVGIPFQDFLHHCVNAGVFVAARGREEAWLVERSREHGNPSSSSEHLLSNGRWYRFTERRTADGSFVGLRADITDEKLRALALEESEERYRALFQGSRSVQLLIAPDTGGIVECNDAACRYYGYARDTLTALSLDDITVARPEDGLAATRRATEHVQSVVRERHRLASGTVRDVETHAGPVSVNGRPLIYAVVHDIGDRIQAETQRETLMANVERANAELEHFAHVVSHDLREPLRMITTSLGMVSRRHADSLPDDARAFLDFAMTGATDLDALIVDLLDYARAGRDVRPLSLLPSRPLLEEALGTLSAQIAETGAAVTLAPDPWPRVRGDANQLTCLFINLIGNALKYRHVDRPVRIRLSHTRVNHGGRPFTGIAIADNGIGIPAGQRDRIFMIFHRLHTRETYPGTGIGLAIARKVVNRCQGHILVESEEGQGTTFTVLFPVVPDGDAPP
nr:ATP-binding protein [Roseospira visakhapatnamensis]